MERFAFSCTSSFVFLRRVPLTYLNLTGPPKSSVEKDLANNTQALFLRHGALHGRSSPRRFLRGVPNQCLSRTS